MGILRLYHLVWHEVATNRNTAQFCELGTMLWQLLKMVNYIVYYRQIRRTVIVFIGKLQKGFKGISTGIFFELYGSLPLLPIDKMYRPEQTFKCQT